MSELHEQPFPRGILLAALGLIVASIALAGIARVTDIGAVRSPEAKPVAARSLWFEDRSDGSVAVYAASPEEDDGARPKVATALLEPGTNGFIRSVMRGLARERRQHGEGAELPFRLTHWSDGRLSLDDVATGRHVELNAFGPTNVGAFARLLENGGMRFGALEADPSASLN